MELVIEGATQKGPLKDRINFMPFNLDYQGPANTGYLIIKDSRSSFRGRELVEKIVKVPGEKYHGVMMSETNAPPSDVDAKRFWRANATFTELSVWGADVEPLNDPIIKAIKYLQVADLV